MQDLFPTASQYEQTYRKVSDAVSGKTNQAASLELIYHIGKIHTVLGQAIRDFTLKLGHFYSSDNSGNLPSELSNKQLRQQHNQQSVKAHLRECPMTASQTSNKMEIDYESSGIYQKTKEEPKLNTFDHISDFQFHQHPQKVVPRQNTGINKYHSKSLVAPKPQPSANEQRTLFTQLQTDYQSTAEPFDVEKHQIQKQPQDSHERQIQQPRYESNIQGRLNSKIHHSSSFDELMGKKGTGLEEENEQKQKKHNNNPFLQKNTRNNNKSNDKAHKSKQSSLKDYEKYWKSKASNEAPQIKVHKAQGEPKYKQTRIDEIASNGSKQSELRPECSHKSPTSSVSTLTNPNNVVSLENHPDRRKKQFREKNLVGVECPDCSKFYELVGMQNSEDVKKYSRHRVCQSRYHEIQRSKDAENREKSERETYTDGSSETSADQMTMGYGNRTVNQQAPKHKKKSKGSSKPKEEYFEKEDDDSYRPYEMSAYSQDFQL